MKPLKYLDNSGFSMIQVLIASGLIGALSVAMMNIFETQSKSQKRMEQSFQLNSIAIELQTIFVRETSCTETFKDKLITSGPTSLSSLIHKNKDGSTILRTINIGDKMGNGITLKNIELSNPYNIAPNSDGIMNVELQFDRRLADGVTIQAKKDIKIFSITDGSGKIVRCLGMLDAVQEEAIGEALEEMCNSMGGVFNLNNKSCNINSAIEKISAKKTCDILGAPLMTGGLTCDLSNLNLGSQTQEPTPNIKRHIYDVTLSRSFRKNTAGGTQSRDTCSGNVSCSPFVVEESGSRCDPVAQSQIRTSISNFMCNLSFRHPSPASMASRAVVCPAGSSPQVISSTNSTQYQSAYSTTLKNVVVRVQCK